MSDDRFTRDDENEPDDERARAAGTALRHGIHALLVASWPRWLEPREMELALVARRVPRTLRAMMEEDRARPYEMRLYEEREVQNSNNSQRHKVYRALVRKAPPTLF